MEIKTMKLTWEELDSIFETIFENILCKSVKCKADFDDHSYWGVRFMDYQMPIVEVEQICQLVKANDDERKEAFPPDNEAYSNDFGMSIADKLLSWHLGCTWKKLFADEDALYLLECADIE